MPSDWELLNEYMAKGSDDAFRRLVERHAGMVRSCARRIVRNDSVADEVAQAVFLLLLRKAKTFCPGIVIAGWLYRTARLVSLQALRAENRRMSRDEQFSLMISEDETTLAWNQMEGLLEPAMARLSEADRDAIVLRFFEGRSFAEVAEGLGTTEAAAKMRVTRSLSKLRQAMQALGLPVSFALLMATLSAHASAPVPTETLFTVLTKTCQSSPSSRVSDLVTETLKMTAYNKLKTTLIVAAMALLLTTSIGVLNLRSQRILSVPEPESSALSFRPMEGKWQGSLLVRSDLSQPGSAQPVNMTVTLDQNAKTCEIALDVLNPDGRGVVHYQFSHSFSSDGKQILTNDDPKVGQLSGPGEVTESRFNSKTGNWTTAVRAAHLRNDGFTECRWSRQEDGLLIYRHDITETDHGEQHLFSEMTLHRPK